MQLWIYLVGRFGWYRESLVKKFGVCLISSSGHFLTTLALIGCNLEDPSLPPVHPDTPPPPGAFARSPESNSESVSSSINPQSSDSSGNPQPVSSSSSVSSCSQSGVIFCDSGTYSRGYATTVSQFRGSSGFVEYNISGIFLEGRQQKYGVLFLSERSGFEGDNWIYIKGIDTFPGRPVGAWKIEAEAQGIDTEGQFMGSHNFNRSQTYKVRVEWGGRRVRALIDGREYTSLSLPREVVINSLSLWINETPRAGIDRPYPGAVISNIAVGQ